MYQSCSVALMLYNNLFIINLFGGKAVSLKFARYLQITCIDNKIHSYFVNSCKENSAKKRSRYHQKRKRMKIIPEFRVTWWIMYKKKSCRKKIRSEGNERKLMFLFKKLAFHSSSFSVCTETWTNSFLLSFVKSLSLLRIEEFSLCANYLDRYVTFSIKIRR